MRASVLALVVCVTASETMAQPHLVVPDAPDLMLKTRRIEVGREGSASIQVLYLKGARQRRQSQPESAHAGGLGWFDITRCDARRSITLDTRAKTYAYRDIEEPSAYFARLRKSGTPEPPPPPDAPVMRVTIETNDTGERRSFGSYVARHVISTRKTELPAGNSAGRGPIESRTDGWYIDVPEMTCWDASIVTESILVGFNNPRMITKVDRRGNGRVGYPIEETGRFGDRAWSHETRVELIEVSEAPLDDALFEVPKDYQPALQTPYGPDMSKPDTILNRLSWYGNQAVATVRRWFGSPTYGAGY